MTSRNITVYRRIVSTIKLIYEETSTQNTHFWPWHDITPSMRLMAAPNFTSIRAAQFKKYSSAATNQLNDPHLRNPKPNRAHGPKGAGRTWGGVPKVPPKIDCHIHHRVSAGRTGGGADDLRGETALVPPTEHLWWWWVRSGRISPAFRRACASH